MLILALLVLSAIMAASVGLGSIIISGIRQARSIDNSIVAYYAAESGVEESLYKSRKREADVASDIANTDTELSNEAYWEIGSYNEEASDTEDKFSLYELPEDRFVQFEVYDTGQGEIQSLRIKGENGEASSWAQITWFGRTMAGELSDIKIEQFPLNSEEGRVVDLSSVGLQYDAYRVKITALYDDINNLEITGHIDRAGTEPEGGTPLPSRIVVLVGGIYRNSKQVLKFAMPRRSPLGGIFDFVLFSECSILKGLEGNCF